MNELQIFENEEFGEVRTVVIDGEIWFVGKDVAEALHYKNSRQAIATNVMDDDKGVHPVDTLSGKQNMTIVNESGLYSLVFGSKLDSAKRFKHWITSVVIPSLRKTGSYTIDKPRDSYMIEDPIERAKRWIEEYEEKLALEEKIKEDKPKVEYFDSIVEARLLTNFRDTAKELHLSQTQFTGWLLDKKFIYRDSRGTLLPYEPYRANGWFQVKDYVNRYNGFAGLRTLITPTGKAALKLILESEECSMSDFKKHGGRRRKSGS